MVGCTLPDIWLMQGCYMPSVAHPGNQNNVQWLWILYTPEIYCWTLIDTAQRSPSINKPPSLHNQSSGLIEWPFLSYNVFQMLRSSSVYSMKTQTMLQCFPTTKHFIKYNKNVWKSFHKLSANCKCKINIIFSKNKTISNELSKGNVFPKYVYKES